jgi:L-fuconolactonase
MPNVTAPSGRPIRVVDAQVHLNRLGIAAGLAAMDAVGIDSVLIDEFWGWDDSGMRIPNYLLPNGARRYEYPIATEAAIRFPDRFGTMAWVDRNDPELDDVFRRIRENPHQRCVRLPIRPENGDDVALAAGEYDTLFSLAEANGVPIMFLLPRVDLSRRLGLIEPQVCKFASLQFILDHGGVLPLSHDDLAMGADCPSSLETVLPMSKYSNVAIKWDSVPLLSKEPFPFSDIIAYLEQFILAFGARRIMWGSDYTQTRYHHTWAESFNYILTSDRVSDEDREWILGKTARTILEWPEARSSFGWSTRLDRQNHLVAEPQWQSSTGLS